MRRSLLRLIFVSALLSLATAATAFGQDFNKSYRLAAGGTISIRTVSGDVDVTGYDGEQVVVHGIKEGRDRDMVEVEDTSGANNIDVRVRYPRDCHNCNASVRFEVKVPRSTRYVFNPISSASGNIKMTGLTGDIKVNTASGDVLVRDVTGAVSASTASGNVDVEIARLEGEGGMKFSSASGDVSVRLPSNLDADVRMSTSSGRIKTNFPIEVRESEHGSGSKAEGRLGSGARLLRISSASGDVSLTSQ